MENTKSMAEESKREISVGEDVVEIVAMAGVGEIKIDIKEEINTGWDKERITTDNKEAVV